MGLEGVHILWIFKRLVSRYRFRVGLCWFLQCFLRGTPERPQHEVQVRLHSTVDMKPHCCHLACCWQILQLVETLTLVSYFNWRVKPKWWNWLAMTTLNQKNLRLVELCHLWEPQRKIVHVVDITFTVSRDLLGINTSVCIWNLICN